MFFHQPINSLSANNYNASFYRETKIDFHFHKNFEIVYVINGSVRCIVNNKETHLESGDFGLCLSNDIHSYIPSENSLYWVCVFSADYVRVFSKQVSGKIATNFKFKCSDSVKAFINDNLISETPPPINMLKACLYAVCNEFLNNVGLTDKKTDKLQIMSTIIDYVAEHHTENITLSDIANILGFNYHYVSKYFNSIFNMTFNEFLNMHRLETAMRLLDESDKKLVDIAYESGFQSVRTFNDCFRKHFQATPSEYRKLGHKMMLK